MYPRERSEHIVTYTGCSRDTKQAIIPQALNKIYSTDSPGIRKHPSLIRIMCRSLNVLMFDGSNVYSVQYNVWKDAVCRYLSLEVILVQAMTAIIQRC